MAFISTIYWHTLVDKLHEAKFSIYLVLPSIDEELAQCLLTIQSDKRVTISLCIDNSEAVIRNGYGEAKGIEDLINSNITIKERSGNRISFIIIDNSGFLLFPESRIFSEKPTGPNAIELDLFTATRLIAHYFPPENDQQKVDVLKQLSQAFDRSEKWIDEVNEEIGKGVIPVSRTFKIEEFEKIKKALEKNPPIAPDLQRQIKTYTAKVQFVELKFSGINLQSRTINIPKDALPISNVDLKNLLLTKMKLFQNLAANKSFEVFTQLKKKVEIVREDYLKPISCREGKSLIEIENKNAFISRLEKIKEEIQEVNKHLPDIIEAATLETKDVIRKELMKHFKAEPPEELLKYQNSQVREAKLKDYVDHVIFRIPFPKTERLIEKISLTEFFNDLTFQDFSDEKLINELLKKKIMEDEDIKGIVEMKNAFAEKR